MIGYRFWVILATCLTCLGFTPSVSLAFRNLERDSEPFWVFASQSVSNAETVLLAQNPPVLQIGSQGEDVKELQQKLQQLGLFDQEINGVYEETTKTAVAQFQEQVDLDADGVVGTGTWTELQAQVESLEESQPSSSETSESEGESTDEVQDSNFLWLLVGVGGVGLVLSGGLFFLFRGNQQPSEDLQQQESQNQANPQSEQILQKPQTSPANNSVQNLPTLNPPESFPHHPTETNHHQKVSDSSNSEEEFVPVEQTTRLAKVDIIDELIKDLGKSDRKQRRKAIWELAQRADSRAVQPLVDCIINSDSQEQGLILEALSQIGSRTLKPMSHALALSLRDENPEVRKNAIRDLTRIYEMISSMGQLLSHAADDPDAEVRETAEWALKQLNQMQMPVNINRLPMDKEQ